MAKRKQTEFIYLRTFLCMLIVLTHILTEYTIANEVDDNQIQVLYWIRMVLIIGTPSFIILSQLLVTFNYDGKLKKGYLRSRMMYILCPYLIIGAFYSYSESEKMNDNFMDQYIENVLLGNWYGYFIVVILQFFILNWLIYKINPNILYSKWSLAIGFIVNTAYLYSYQSIDTVANFIDTYYPFSDYTFIGAWIFYYFLGSYLGHNYYKIKRIAREHIALIAFLAMLSYMLLKLLGEHDYWSVSSMDYRIILYITFGFLILLNFSVQFDAFMYNSVYIISSYSLFIYLMHPIILEYMYQYTSTFQEQTMIFIPISLLFIIGCCIGVGILLREFSIFQYVIGKQPYNDLRN